MLLYLQLHCLHQSLRDLTSEQVRLGDDISRELSRRNRYKQKSFPDETEIKMLSSIFICSSLTFFAGTMVSNETKNVNSLYKSLDNGHPMNFKFGGETLP